MNLFYWFVRTLIWIGFKVLYRHKVIGPAVFPKGGAIIAANHLSHLDPPAVGISWPRAVHFIARATLFDQPLLRFLITRLNAHPIDQEKNDLAALRKIIKMLKEGKKVVIFPEGARSLSGELQDPQPGTAMLAMRAGVPIIPAHITGTGKIMPPGKKLKWKGRTRVVFGDPIYPEEFLTLGRKEAQQALTEAMMTRIKSL